MDAASSADLTHAVVGTVAVLLYFGAVWDLVRFDRRRWRRFCMLSCASLCLGIYAAQQFVPDIGILAATWLTIAIVVNLFDSYHFAPVPQVLGHRWGNLPPRALTLLDEIDQICLKRFANESITDGNIASAPRGSDSLLTRYGEARNIVSRYHAARADLAAETAKALRSASWSGRFWHWRTSASAVAVAAAHAQFNEQAGLAFLEETLLDELAELRERIHGSIDELMTGER